MSAYRILFTKSAEREFQSLPREIQRRFALSFETLVGNPHRRQSGCDVRRLAGTGNGWRLRVGRYRGIYAVEGDVVVFTRFGPRATIYRV